jgi:hypothetical protein
MRLSLFILCFFLGSTVTGQNINKGSRVLLGSSIQLDNASVYIYEPPFLAKGIYKDTTEAVNKFPEQLMSSIISTTNQKWIDYNTLHGALNSEKKDSKYFDYIRTMDKNKNFFELRLKMSFTINDNEFAIIKFYLSTEETVEAKSGVYVMQKIENRWFTTRTSFTSDLALMIMRFDEDKFLTVLKARPIGNELMDELIEKVKVNSSVDLSKLYKEFSSWYSNDDLQKIEYFIDSKAW